jgi:Caspase domain
MQFVRKFLASAFLVGASASAQAPLDVRIALVIGNATYQHVPALQNSGNDAKDIGATLRTLGFTVEELRDGSRAQMVEAIARVRDKLKGQQGLGMLYYAGHGMQVDWRNFMLPVEMQLTKASDVPQQAVDVNAVLDAFKGAGTRMNVLVLDACRDNPFTKGATSGKGLAPMDAPPGTLLAYATAPGNVAEDGGPGEENGLYTQYLLNELRRPQARIEDVFKRVRLQVRQKSQGRQIPWESTSLEEDFSFNQGAQGLRAEDLDLMAKEAKQKEQQLAKAAVEAREREKIAAVALEREKTARVSYASIERQARLDSERERLAAIALAREREVLMAAAATAEREKALAALAKQAQDRLALQLAADAKALDAVKSQEQAAAQEKLLAVAQAKELEKAQSAERAAQTAKDIEQKRQRDIQQAAQEAKAREAERQLSSEKAKEQRFLAEKAEWERIKDTKTPEQVYAFLDKFPSGYISELAQLKLEKVEKTQIITQPEKGGAVQSSEVRRFRLGDKYDIVITDLLTKVVQDRSTFSVVAANDEVAEFNQGYKVTQSGAIIRTIAGATHDPYQQWIPSGEYQIGKKWTTRTILTPKGESPMWAEITGKVVARETVTVPAGSFETYKMEMEQTAQDGSRLKITYWGQPDWGVAVKQIREVRERNGRLSGQIYELAKRERVK